jgi:hypothetical protein
VIHSFPLHAVKPQLSFQDNVTKSTNRAFYPFAVVPTEKRQVEEMANQWVVHSQLQAL